MMYKNSHKKLNLKQGYILFLTISFIAIMTLVVTQIYYLGTGYNVYVPLTIERERAKQLALSGVAIATAQLLLQDSQMYSTTKSDKDKDSEKKGEQNPEKNKKALLKTLLMIQNQWQEFNLTTAHDGFDGLIKICIACESGKINLNKLYDFKRKVFYATGIKTTTEPFVKYIAERMKDFFKDIDIQSVLVDTLKKRKSQFATPMDLLMYKQCAFFSNNVYYMPAPVNKDASVQLQPQLYLNDLFTVYTQDLALDPFLLSNSMRLLLGFKTGHTQKKEDIAAMLEKISLDNIHWEKSWDVILKEPYGKEFKALSKEIASLLSTKFEPRVFSVVSYGKVGRVEQKLLAILERSTEDKEDIITVKKIYWL